MSRLKFLCDSCFLFSFGLNAGILRFLSQNSLMSSQWTNKYAIMRDLSMAQGCVPVDFDKTVSPDQKPPTPLVCEDTEEEFFRHCIGHGDFTAPDLGLIQQMLDMVRDVDISSDTENDKTEIEISKLNPKAKEFVWKRKEKTDTAPDLSDTKLLARKKEPKFRSIHNVRNVAVTSIMEGIANNPSKSKENLPTEITTDLTTLLKSNEPQPSPNMANSLQKVNNWLESNQNPKRAPLLLDPSTMFKKKVSKSPPKEVTSPVNVNVNVKSPLNVSLQYKPTAQAEEYYKKYLEKSQLRQTITEDIWTKAERLMKEREAKRKQDAEQSLAVSPCSILTGSETECSDGPQLAASSDAIMDIVKLPMHRHQLTGECVVCKVLCGKAYRETTKIRKM